MVATRSQAKESAPPPAANKEKAPTSPTGMDVDSEVPAKSEAELALALAADIKSNVSLLEKSVAELEKRFALRALRSIPSLRKRLTVKSLADAVDLHIPASSGVKSSLLSLLGGKSPATASTSMDVDSVDVVAVKDKKSLAVPEIELYFSLLTLIHLLDTKQAEKGIKLADETVLYVAQLNRRTADPVSSLIFYYMSMFYENAGRLADCLPLLLSAHRTAALRRDSESEAVLINLLLRNYLHFSLFDQADKLVVKSIFPETAGNNQTARYMFYTGRIKAIQLDYTLSHKYLMQAVRKAPQNSATGFQQTAQKFAVIVQLLMGEIPERALFRQQSLQRALTPYFHLTQAVRIGDLAKFQAVLAEFGAQFKKDKTYTLILRLRHNVIKTGIRMISLAYSRISLKDICLRLHLDSEEDAEYIVAKAIRDGVIDAVLDHEHGQMKSKEIVDFYTTQEPQKAFHDRITFCLNLHQDSVKAMRYPESKQKKDFETADEMRDIEREISNLVEEMEDDL